MGMTIDNCIDYYNRSFAIGDTDAARQHNDVLEMTIETMRKYQKIAKIIRKYDVAWEFHHMKTTIDEIREVIEDGDNT